MTDETQQNTNSPECDCLETPGAFNAWAWRGTIVSHTLYHLFRDLLEKDNLYVELVSEKDFIHNLADSSGSLGDERTPA